MGGGGGGAREGGERGEGGGGVVIMECRKSRSSVYRAESNISFLL